MARIKPIRITSNDVKEFERLARNTKAKIKRTFKAYGVDLSDKIDIPKKVSDFKTRQEFNAWKEQARSITNRHNTEYQFKKNKYGVVASVKEINQAKRLTKQAQRVAKKIIKDVKDKPYMVGGKQYGTVGKRAEQLKQPVVGEIHVPPDFKFDSIVNRKHLQEKIDSLGERSKPDFLDTRSERLKQNYIKLLQTHYNSDADEIVKEIQNIPSTDFFEIFLMHDEFQFEWEYTEEETEGSLEKKKAIIERYKEGKVGLDLKGF